MNDLQPRPKLQGRLKEIMHEYNVEVVDTEVAVGKKPSREDETSFIDSLSGNRHLGGDEINRTAIMSLNMSKMRFPPVHGYWNSFIVQEECFVL